LLIDLRTGERYALEDVGTSSSESELNQILEKLRCPVTGLPLLGHLTPYPQSFLYKEQIAHFNTNFQILPDNESFFQEFWEIPQ
jgi:hypothetical protein